MSETEGPKTRLAAPATVAGIANGNETTSSSPLPVPVQRLDLLVVEDDPDTQALMRALLRHYYEVATVASEAEFWTTLETLAPCIILMDVTLKGSQDGLTLTRQFRADPQWNSIPVVALTAHATTEDRERALAAGCAAYLSKPVERRRLLELIGSLLAPRL